MSRSERRYGKGHGHSMIAVSVGDTSSGLSVPMHDEAVGTLVGVDPEGPKSRNEHGDPVALLDAQLRRAAHRDLTAVGRERGKGRKFVDQRRHFRRNDLDCACSVSLDDDCASWLSGVRGGLLNVYTGPESTEHVEKRRPRGIE